MTSLVHKCRGRWIQKFATPTFDPELIRRQVVPFFETMDSNAYLLIPHEGPFGIHGLPDTLIPVARSAISLRLIDLLTTRAVGCPVSDVLASAKPLLSSAMGSESPWMRADQAYTIPDCDLEMHTVVWRPIPDSDLLLAVSQFATRRNETEVQGALLFVATCGCRIRLLD